MKGWYLLMLLPLLFSNCKKEEQAKIDRDKILQYIEDNNLQDIIEDPTGLFYKIRVEGTGENPTLDNKIKVSYKGFFLNGFVFDETEPGEVVPFVFDNLITGWRIGIPKMKKGGEATLLVPSALGYGNNPPPGIPTNSVLLFEIKLVDFQ